MEQQRIESVIRIVALTVGCLLVLPFVQVPLGVFGGIIAFGFVGIFLGPTLPALGFRFVRRRMAPAIATTTA